MKLTNQDRLTFLTARIKRADSQKKVYKDYAFRDILLLLELDTSEVLLSDSIQALTENNEMEAEMAERYSI
mgnify:CR=1 FL=1